MGASGDSVFGLGQEAPCSILSWLKKAIIIPIGGWGMYFFSCFFRILVLIKNLGIVPFKISPQNSTSYRGGGEKKNPLFLFLILSEIQTLGTKIRGHRIGAFRLSHQKKTPEPRFRSLTYPDYGSHCFFFNYNCHRDLGDGCRRRREILFNDLSYFFLTFTSKNNPPTLILSSKPGGRTRLQANGA